jgi:nitrogen fixation-related uncharacterized protein
MHYIIELAKQMNRDDIVMVFVGVALFAVVVSLVFINWVNSRFDEDYDDFDK